VAESVFERSSEDSLDFGLLDVVAMNHEYEVGCRGCRMDVNPR
jgi:hypothetical protein